MSACFAVFFAFLFWGLSPLYWKELSHLPAGYVVLHRILWSFAMLLFWFGFHNFVSKTNRLIHSGDFSLRVLAALCLGSNWFVYIMAIETGHTAQASLGYFIMPLMVILIGSIIFKEPFSMLARFATAIACAGICLQLVAAEEIPWFAFGVMTSYLCYTVLYKTQQWPVVEGAFLEMSLLSVAAVVVLLSQYQNLIPEHSILDWALLAGAGPATIIPVLLCNFGIKKVDFVIVGPLQYLNPSLQFLIATIIFGELVSSIELYSFIIVWLGCAVFLFDRVWLRGKKSQMHAQPVLVENT